MQLCTPITDSSVSTLLAPLCHPQPVELSWQLYIQLDLYYHYNFSNASINSS